MIFNILISDENKCAENYIYEKFSKNVLRFKKKSNKDL